MTFRWRTLLLLMALLLGLSSARNGGEALNHYGLVTLSDNAVGARLAARFKARGQPVFLVHDLNAGLGQNDIMRFTDKAVLIDGDVWSTLQAEGALEKLRTAPLVRVQGRATSAIWGQRAGLVSGDRQRKAFKVGAELLRVLEENFGGPPQGQQMTVIFEQDHLTLLAPSAFLDQLRFSAVRKVAESGKPSIISTPPDSNLFAGEPFDFQIWAADPTDPSGELTYQLTGEPPAGLTWNAATHTLSGKPAGPGRWRLSATVQNSGGFRDTLVFVLRVRANQAPVLAGEPRAVAVAEREWRFAPLMADMDHPGYALKVRPGVLPPGMFFNPESASVRWVPPSSLVGTRQSFSLQVEDVLGATREFKYAVQVVAKAGILLSEGVKIELPWDTLINGRTYVWKTGAIRTAWAGQGIQLLGIEGSESTVLTGDSLVVKPTKAGIHQLDFRFTAQGVPLSQSLFLYVKEDQPPEFVTELPDWDLHIGEESRRYRPVAIDPEGEDVTVTAQFDPESPIAWDGKRLQFDPRARGAYPVHLRAEDAGGKSADQWLVFEAEPVRAGSHFIVESRVHGEFTAWTTTLDFGTGRIGLYSPNLSYGTIPWSYWMYKETPYIFFGGNLMGRKAEALDRKLWADVGFAFRNPAPRVYAGGIYTRLNGEWHFPGSTLSWIEMEVTGHIHQLMVATDSAMFATMMRDPNDIISRDTLSRNGTLSKIIREGFRQDNVRFYSRIEALGPLGWGIYAGPSMWRDDVVIAQEHYQRFGGALRFKSTTDSDLYQFTLRVGWGPGGDGWGAYGSMRLAFGMLY